MRMKIILTIFILFCTQHSFAQLDAFARWVNFGKTLNGASYDASSVFQSIQGDLNTDLAVDSEGNVYMTGRYTDTLNLFFYPFNMTQGNGYPVEQGNKDFFLAKYNPHGDLLWVVIGGGEEDSTDRVNDKRIYVAVDPEDDDRIYIAGSADHKLRLATGPGTIFPRQDVGTENCHCTFVARYNKNGNLQWSDTDGVAQNGVSAHESWATGIQVDHNHHLILYGHYEYKVEFGAHNSGSGGTTESLHGQESCAFIGSYEDTNTGYKLNWINEVKTASNNEILDVAIASDNHIYASGVTARYNSPDEVLFTSASNTCWNGPSPLPAYNNSYAFVIKYDPSGCIDWHEIAGTNDGVNGDSLANALTLAENELYVYTTGWVAGKVSFNGGLGSIENVQSILASGGAYSKDFFIARYKTTDGAIDGAQSFGGEGDDIGYGITSSDKNNGVYVTGRYQSNGLWGANLGNLNGNPYIATNIYGQLQSSPGHYILCQPTNNYMTETNLFPTSTAINPSSSSTSFNDAFLAKYIVGSVSKNQSTTIFEPVWVERAGSTSIDGGDTVVTWKKDVASNEYDTLYWGGIFHGNGFFTSAYQCKDNNPDAVLNLASSGGSPFVARYDEFSAPSTSAENSSPENSLLVSPNPFTENITLTGLLAKNYQIQISDSAGKIVFSQSVNGPEVYLNLSPLSAGSYNLSLYLKNKKLISRHLVKIN